MVMYKFPVEGGKPQKLPIPESEKEHAEKLRSELLEKAAENDENLMELYFEKGSLDEAELMKGLKGVQQTRSLSDVFSQEESGQSIIKMMELDMIVGSGGVLSHAPRRNQSMSMMIDAFQPQGITMLTVDSIFMMPHLGVLSKINKKAATEVFERDCLVYLGTCIAPAGIAKTGAKIMEYKIKFADNKQISESINFGDMKFYPLASGESAEVELIPEKSFDAGKGKGKAFKSVVKGGVVGLIVDGRGRPLILPTEEKARKEKIIEWNKTMDLYPHY
ncbi:MAG: glutamate mutase L [Oligoflexia bacterium]|nr:glutamate mutase L [Oligoflexia bacterium]